MRSCRTEQREPLKVDFFVKSYVSSGSLQVSEKPTISAERKVVMSLLPIQE
jgi:hypothetical protein